MQIVNSKEVYINESMTLIIEVNCKDLGNDFRVFRNNGISKSAHRSVCM